MVLSPKYQKGKIGHRAYTIMVLSLKYQKGKIGHRAYIKEGLFENNSWIWKQGHQWEETVTHTKLLLIITTVPNIFRKWVVCGWIFIIIRTLFTMLFNSIPKANDISILDFSITNHKGFNGKESLIRLWQLHVTLKCFHL